MEAQDLEIPHPQQTEEKLRLLECQVADLISEVIKLKAWKSDISQHYLALDISCIQSKAVVSTAVKQEQALNDTIKNMTDKAPEECSSIIHSCTQAEEGVLTSNLKQNQVMNHVIEAENGQITAQGYPDAEICQNSNSISSASTCGNAGTETCEVSAPDERTSVSDKDAPIVQVITAVNTQETLSETSGATNESKERSSWFIQMCEEHGALPSEEQGMKLAFSLNDSQKETSFSRQESKKNDATICRMGNKHSVLESLVNSAVQYRSNVASNVQANQENDSKETLQTKDKPKVVERNAYFDFLMNYKPPSRNKNAEEEQDMEDTSVTIKENCPCKITYEETNDFEEEDNTNIVQMVKKMNRIQLEQQYLQLHKRHETLVNGLCDTSTLSRRDDYHALLNAARYGNIEEAILFTFNPTMLQFRDEDGYTPLHLAVWYEHIQICKLLLDCDVSVDVKDNQGNTPLHFAARKGNVDICKVLLIWAAPLNATNSSGSTPLHCAIKEGHAKVFFLLVNEGASVNLSDNRQNTALHMAACNGFLEMCQFLVNQGVELNTQNSMGNTPLHNACRAGHSEVVKYLVKRGADPSLKCKEGKTPKDKINAFAHSQLLEWLTKWEEHMK